MANDNDRYNLVDSRHSFENEYSQFTKLFRRDTDVMMTISVTYKDGLWRIYDVTGHGHIGSIISIFSGFPVFSWTDGVMHADIEDTFEEALRNLCIVHFRRNYKESQ